MPYTSIGVHIQEDSGALESFLSMFSVFSYIMQPGASVPALQI